ncbi:DUF3306 domain-containing protein [Jannaschia aquimarina]|uniref:DUF3306 domain-containing protein n=1 Tax=Jannaschia aquimarina TaxID=935700 RepID=A0A0D1D6Y6_9RHOB|nr:DUF3306 domain-containing protein [Jannaschia aquimarina]KIT15713.1 hypothetical protein jaqu_25900 [Jannaschia aquimarina]SNT38801.1 Protein of unknown function [Jannaschia aquimarina]
MSDFWSRRREAVAAEAEVETRAAREAQVKAEIARLEDMDEAEALDALDLPVPESLKAGDEVTAFLREGVPELIRRRALRQLWKVNPALANLDGLVDYGEDFTDAATVVENLSTAYQVGKGMAAHVMELARQAEDEEDAAPDAPADVMQDITEDEVRPAVTATDEPLAAEPETVAVAEPVAAAPRRMAFTFPGDAA